MAGGGAEPPRATTPERAPASPDPRARAPPATAPDRAPDAAPRAAAARGVSHKRKEVHATARAVCEDASQVVDVLDYVITGARPGPRDAAKHMPHPGPQRRGHKRATAPAPEHLGRPPPPPPSHGPPPHTAITRPATRPRPERRPAHSTP